MLVAPGYGHIAADVAEVNSMSLYLQGRTLQIKTILFIICYNILHLL